MSKLGRWLPLSAVLALLGAAMFAAVYANPVIENLPPVNRPIATPAQDATTTTVTASAEPTVSPRPPSPGATVPSWVTWLLTGLCAAAVLAVIIALLWATLRDRLFERKVVLTVSADAQAAQRELEQRVRAAVDEGLADLDDADQDPRRAVIACWVRLENAAAAAGTPREPGDTSTELVARLLRAHAVSADVLAGFAAVYREARFAHHAIDATTREQARSALRQLRDELAGTAPAVGGATR